MTRVISGKGQLRFIVRCCLLIYFLVLCWLGFFYLGSKDRISSFTKREIHIIPFENTYTSIKAVFSKDFQHAEKALYQFAVIRNILGNLLLLMPWGFLAPLAFKFQTAKSIVISSCLISFIIELIQFSFKIGVFDIDDIMYNTIGAVLGFYLLRFVWQSFFAENKYF